MSDLFRKSVLERNQVNHGVVVKLTTPLMKFFIFLLFIFAAAIVMIVVFGEYNRKASVIGYILPDKGLLKVYPSRSGRIIKRNISEGQLVGEGDVLFSIDAAADTLVGNSTENVKGALENQASLLEKEIGILRKIHAGQQKQLSEQLSLQKNRLNYTNNEIVELEKNYTLTMDNVERQKKLLKKEFTTRSNFDEVEQERINANLRLAEKQQERLLSQSEIASLARRLSGIYALQARELTNLERLLAEINLRLSELAERGTILIKAPFKGYVTRLTAIVGSRVSDKLPLLTMIPHQAIMKANLYIPSESAGFVKEGTNVLLRYDAYPFQKFGSFKAKIETISRTSVSGEELPFPIDINQPVYISTAELEKDVLTIDGKQVPLQIGAKFQADLILERIKVWELFLGPIKALKRNL